MREKNVCNAGVMHAKVTMQICDHCTTLSFGYS